MGKKLKFKKLNQAEIFFASQTSKYGYNALTNKKLSPQEIYTRKLEAKYGRRLI